MRITLELSTPAAAALAKRAVQHHRPVALEAQRIIERSLGLADCDCRIGRGKGAQGNASGERDTTLRAKEA
jgi:hypothetical protein